MTRRTPSIRPRKSLLPQNPLFRLLLVNGIIGIGISLLVLASLFYLNIGNLRSLVVTAEDPFVPVLMLAFGLIITLCSVVMGSAVMMLKPEDTGRGKGGGRGIGIERLLGHMARPAVVPAPARRKR
jgi:hypothetical protein